MERVLLAFSGERTGERIREILETAGLAECTVCHSFAEVKRLANEQQVALVICGYQLKDETAQGLLEDLSLFCPVLVIAKQAMLDMLDCEEIFKLSAPVKYYDLTASVRTLLRLSQQIERERAERVCRLQEEKQKRVEAAKQVLMERNGMDEGQAHRFLQKKSMDFGVKLFQTAQMVLDGTLKL